MERVKLSKEQKAVLRLLGAGVGNCPATFPSHVFVSCVASLERMGFARGAWTEGGGLEAARIPPFGAEYLALNPSLRNPTEWGKVGALVSAAAAVAAALALLVACGVM